MTIRSGSADLPLHHGRVPAWLGQRMTRLGAVISPPAPTAPGEVVDLDDAAVCVENEVPHDPPPPIH